MIQFYFLNLISLISWTGVATTTLPELGEITSRFLEVHTRSDSKFESHSKNKEKIALCRKNLIALRSVAKTLLHFYPQQNNSQTAKNAKFLSTAQSMQCQQSHWEALIARMDTFANHHESKIGVLLSFDGAMKSESQAMKSGMLSAITNLGISKNRVVFIDTFGNDSGLKEGLSKLILNEKVTVIIGGQKQSEHHIISQITKPLKITTFLLAPISNENKDLTTFSVFPSENLLADLIAKESRARNIKSLTLLQPTKNSSSKFYPKLQAELKNKGIELKKIIPYISGDYKSMLHATAELTQTNPRSRPEDYRALYLEKKQQAEIDQQPFDPNTVILPAKIDSDAVMIPDNALIVRMFVKLLKYHKAPKVTLIGNQQWRSKDLLEPWDTYLKNSFFVDYVGPYNELPLGIGDFAHSPNFITSQQTRQVDLAILGYKAIERAYKNLPSLLLARSSAHLNYKDQNSNREAPNKPENLWAHYVIDINSGSLNFNKKI